jgi:hypothetical protein
MVGGIDLNGLDDTISVGTMVKIKKALLIAIIAIIVHLIFIITSLIFTIIILSRIDEPYFDSLVIIYFIDNTIGYLLIGTFFALMIVWLVKYFRASKELNDRSRKIIAWSIGVFSAYIIIYFIYWFTISQSLLYMAAYEKISYGWYEGSNSFIWFFITAALIMVFILPLQPITNKKTAMIALIGGSILLVGMNTLTNRLWEDIGERMAGSDIYKSFYLSQIFIRYPIILISYTLIGISYILTYKKLSTFDIQNSSWESRRKDGRLARSPIRKFFKIGDRNPYRMLIFIGIFSLIFSIIIGATADDPFAERYVSSDFEWEYQPEEGIYTTAFDGFVNEGEEIEESLEIGVEVSYMVIQLRWRDEGDLRGRENQGDHFELETSADGIIENDAGINPHGEEGFIQVSYADLGYINDLSIIIRLTNAGDQKLIFGPGVLSWTDDGNNYEVLIEIGYIA